MPHVVWSVLIATVSHAKMVDMIEMPLVKSYSYSQNQISTEVNAKFDTGIRI